MQISVGEGIKRVGSKRKYYKFVKTGMLPIHHIEGMHSFHVEDDFTVLENNLSGNLKKAARRFPKHSSGRKLTAAEKIMLA